jgi:hypothetical protein
MAFHQRKIAVGEQVLADVRLDHIRFCGLAYPTHPLEGDVGLVFEMV